MLGDELRLGLLHAAPCTVQEFLLFSFSWFHSIAGIDYLLYWAYLKHFTVRMNLNFLLIDILSRQLVYLNRGIFRTEY